MSEQGILLLVDDEEMNRDMLGRRLQRKGYTVRTAESGTAALEAIEREAFDLVLLDIQMSGMSGIEVLERIRRTHSAIELPVIMVTAKSDSEDIVEALDVGANDYVTKPIDFPVALARIRAHLSRKRMEARLRESEERYTLAFLGAHDGLWDWDLRSNEMFYSPRWKSMLGFADHEIGRSTEEWFRRVHPEEIDRVRLDIQAHLGGETPHFESEHRMLHADGSYRWMKTRGLAVRDASGKATRMAGSQTDITKQKLVDPLTGLPNQMLLLDRLGRAIERTRRYDNYLFAVLALDLDRFKRVNDSFGPAVGDQFLIAIARRLVACLRSGDSVARFGSTIARPGSDEFTILLDDIQHPGNALAVAGRIQKELDSPFQVAGHEVFTTASIGIALSSVDGHAPENLLQEANIALSRAKASGRARYEVFDREMRDRAANRLQLETDLRKALKQGEFRLQYQPIVSLRTGTIDGFEALLRWNHHERGNVPPTEFIPVLEELGLIVPVNLWALYEACRQMRAWQACIGSSRRLTISTNLSAAQFVQPELVSQIHRILEETGLDPHSLKLEITESTLMEHMESAAGMLRQLKSLNIQLAIDDFGTGYSSLSYLNRFPIDTLKIDGSFVGRLGADEENSLIVRTILTLAHQLGMDVVAEGIETREQAAQLESWQCERGQGYFFSVPLESHVARALIDLDIKRGMQAGQMSRVG